MSSLPTILLRRNHVSMMMMHQQSSTTSTITRKALGCTIAPCSSYHHQKNSTFATSSHSSFSEPVRKKSLITGNESVHSTMKISKSWRNKPLFRRQGDVRFKTGIEAGQLLIKEAMRRDSHEIEFIR
jgi:hypothetical protein